MADLRSLIADILAAHRDRLHAGSPPTITCSCGTWSLEFDHRDVDRAATEHRLHRADAILAALDGRLLPEDGETREEWARYVGGTVSPGVGGRQVRNAAWRAPAPRCDRVARRLAVRVRVAAGAHAVGGGVT